MKDIMRKRKEKLFLAVKLIKLMYIIYLQVHFCLQH